MPSWSGVCQLSIRLSWVGSAVSPVGAAGGIVAVTVLDSGLRPAALRAFTA